MTAFNLSPTARDNHIEAERLAALHTSARDLASQLRQEAISDAGNALRAVLVRAVRRVRLLVAPRQPLVLE
jgi:hypothetical protein